MKSKNSTMKSSRYQNKSKKSCSTDDDKNFKKVLKIESELFYSDDSAPDSDKKLDKIISTSLVEFDHDCQKYLMISTIDGQIWKINPEKKTRTLFVDVSDKVLHEDEDDPRGLLGVTFTHDRFYIYYSSNDVKGETPEVKEVDVLCPETLNQTWSDREKYDHLNVLEEWKLDKYDCPKMVKSFLKIKQPFRNNNGYDNLTYCKSDKDLILVTGDGGSTFDPFNLSQNKEDLYGKVLKIKPEKVRYESDSCVVPFVTRINDIKSGVEIVSRGLRNPVKPLSSECINYLADNGESSMDKVSAFSYYPPNFGWRPYEGIWPTFSVRDNLVNPKETQGISLPASGDPVTFQTSWSALSFPQDGSPKELEIFVGDSVNFFDEPNNVHNLIQTNQEWSPLTNPEFFVEQTSDFDVTLQFNRVGIFYLIDQNFPATSRFLLTVKDRSGTIITQGPINFNFPWNTSEFPTDGIGATFTIFSGDSITFRSTDGFIHGLVETDSLWQTIDNPRFESPPTPFFNETFVFTEPGEVFLVDPIIPDVIRFRVIVNETVDNSPTEVKTRQLLFADQALNNANFYRPFTVTYKSDTRTENPRIRSHVISGISDSKNNVLICVLDTLDDNEERLGQGAILLAKPLISDFEIFTDYIVLEFNDDSVTGLFTNIIRDKHNYYLSTFADDQVKIYKIEIVLDCVSEMLSSEMMSDLDICSKTCMEKRQYMTDYSCQESSENSNYSFLSDRVSDETSDRHDHHDKECKDLTTSDVMTLKSDHSNYSYIDDCKYEDGYHSDTSCTSSLSCSSYVNHVKGKSDTSCTSSMSCSSYIKQLDCDKTSEKSSNCFQPTSSDNCSHYTSSEACKSPDSCKSYIEYLKYKEMSESDCSTEKSYLNYKSSDDCEMKKDSSDSIDNVKQSCSSVSTNSSRLHINCNSSDLEYEVISCYNTNDIPSGAKTLY